MCEVACVGVYEVTVCKVCGGGRVLRVGVRVFVRSHDSLVILLEPHAPQLTLQSPDLRLFLCYLLLISHQLHVILQLPLPHL